MRLRVVVVLVFAFVTSIPYGTLPASAVTAGCSAGTGTTVVVSSCISGAGNDSLYIDLKRRIRAVVDSKATTRSIRLAIFSWNDGRLDLAELLRDASKEMPVTVVHEGGSLSDNVRRTLGADVRVVCSNGCISGSNDAINHNKFVLLRNGSQRTVVQMSMNLTTTQRKKYNNSVTIRTSGTEHADVYRWYGEYFQRLTAKSWNGWTDSGGKTASTSDGGHYMRMYAFPRAASNDPVKTILNNIECTSSHKTVWIAMSKWSKRDALIDALDDLEDNGGGTNVGCDVRVIVQDNADHKNVEMKRAGYNLANSRVAHNNLVHHKFIVVDARFNGTLRKLVFTGSPNFTGDALTLNDEAMVRIGGATTHTFFKDHFRSLWTDGGTVFAAS